MPDEPDWDVRDLAALLGEENAHDPRNYWLCPAGKHWGRFGAAGLLPWSRYQGQVHVLLSLRSSLVEDGGCWGTLGGAIDGGEPGWLAALREAHEEARIHVNAGSIDVNAGSIGSEVVGPARSSAAGVIRPTWCTLRQGGSCRTCISGAAPHGRRPCSAGSQWTRCRAWTCTRVCAARGRTSWRCCDSEPYEHGEERRRCRGHIYMTAPR